MHSENVRCCACIIYITVLSRLDLSSSFVVVVFSCFASSLFDRVVYLLFKCRFLSLFITPFANIPLAEFIESGALISALIFCLYLISNVTVSCILSFLPFFLLSHLSLYVFLLVFFHVDLLVWPESVDTLLVSMFTHVIYL